MAWEWLARGSAIAGVVVGGGTTWLVVRTGYVADYISAGGGRSTRTSRSCGGSAARSRTWPRLRPERASSCPARPVTAAGRDSIDAPASRLGASGLATLRRLRRATNPLVPYPPPARGQQRAHTDRAEVDRDHGRLYCNACSTSRRNSSARCHDRCRTVAQPGVQAPCSPDRRTCLCSAPNPPVRVEDAVLPSSTTRPSTCRKIRYSSRSDTAVIMPNRRRPLVSGANRVLELHTLDAMKERGLRSS
jgi:hypothetical protein